MLGGRDFGDINRRQHGGCADGDAGHDSIGDEDRELVRQGAAQRGNQENDGGENQYVLSSKFAAGWPGEDAANHAADEDATDCPALADIVEVKNFGAGDVTDDPGDDGGVEAEEETAGGADEASEDEV